jgi:hypothetical protein
MQKSMLERNAATDPSWETVWKPLLSAAKEELTEKISAENDIDEVRRLQGALSTVMDLLNITAKVAEQEEKEKRDGRRRYRWRY